MINNERISIYTARLDNRDVIIEKCLNVEKVKLKAEIMDKLMMVNSRNRPHITNYIGFARLEDADTHQSGPAFGSSSSSSAAAVYFAPNAIVTEAAPFGSLDEHITNGLSQKQVLDERQIVEVLQQVAKGMATMHANGMIHRFFAYVISWYINLTYFQLII